MRERPILFSASMIRRLLDGSKLQTRRLVTRATSIVDGQRGAFPWEEFDFAGAWVDPGPSPAGNPGPYLQVPRPSADSVHRVYPRWAVGDLIWCRETWAHDATSLDALRTEVEDYYGSSHGPYYRADGEHENSGLKWRPSIFMSRWASRLTLQIESVRVERLQEISEEDARAEGVLPHPAHAFCKPERRLTQSFATLWDSLNKSRAPWSANPWVFVLTFKRADEKAEAAQ